MEQDAPGEVGLHFYGVQHAVHLRQHHIGAHHRGMHAHMHRAVRLARDSKQLDGVSEFARVSEVLRRQMRNAFAIHIGVGNAGAKGERGEDGEFVGGVYALDVVSGVGFGVSEFLRGGQRDAEVLPFLRHLGEDVVRRAVDDAVDADDVVRHEVAQQGRDDGRATRDARLEQHLDALLARFCQDFRAVLCHDLFVRGYHMLAERYALEDVVERGLLAAHDFHDDVHRRVVKDIIGAGGERAVGQRRRALSAHVAHERALQRYGRAYHLRQLRALVDDDACHAAADYAHAQQSYSYGLFHCAPILSCPSM